MATHSILLCITPRLHPANQIGIQVVHIARLWARAQPPGPTASHACWDPTRLQAAEPQPQQHSMAQHQLQHAPGGIELGALVMPPAAFGPHEAATLDWTRVAAVPPTGQAAKILSCAAAPQAVQLLSCSPAVHQATSRSLWTSSTPQFMSMIKQAASVQELLELYETYHRRLDPAPPSSAAAAQLPPPPHHPRPSLQPPQRAPSSPRPAPGSKPLATPRPPPRPQLQLKPNHLAAMSSRAACLILQGEAQASGPECFLDEGLREAQAREDRRRAPALLEEICLELTGGSAGALTLVDIERLLAAWADLGFNPGTLVRDNLIWQLGPNGGNRLMHAPCRELASLSWSLKRLGWMQGELLALLCSVVKRRVAAFDALGLALVTRTLCTTKALDQQTLSQLEGAAEQLAARFTFPDLVSVLEALVESGSGCHTLLPRASTYLLPHIHSCSSEALSRLALTFARAGYLHGMVFENIAARAILSADSLPLPHISALINAFSLLNISQPDMHTALALRTAQLLRQALHTAAADSPSPAAQPPPPPAGGGGPTTHSKELPPSSALLRLVAPGDVSTLAWDLASAGCYSPELYDAVGDVAAALAGHMGAEALGRVCWALREVQHLHTPLMEAARGRGLELAMQRCWEEGGAGELQQRPAGMQSTEAQPGAGAGRPHEQRGLGRHLHPQLHPQLQQQLQQQQQQQVWGLVQVMAALSFFEKDCTQLLQQIPLSSLGLALEQRYMQQHRQQQQQQQQREQQLRELCGLLDPLTQQLQQQLQSGQCAAAPLGLALRALELLSLQAAGITELPASCTEQVVRALITLGDAGRWQEAELALGQDLMDLLAAWEQSNWESSTRGVRRRQLTRVLLQLGLTPLPASEDSLHHTSVTRGLLPQPLVLVAMDMGRKRVAIEVCDAPMYPVNVAGGGTVAGVAGRGGGPVAGVTGGRGSGVDVWGGRRQPGDVGSVRVGFRSRAFAQRGWLPVALPHWEWDEVRRSDEVARRYLERRILSALHGG